jgi:hypothetical protein
MNDPIQRACLRFGWTAVAVFLTLGIALEACHLFKLPYYLDGTLRRELWTLAHAHGTLLGLLTVVFGLTAGTCLPDERTRRIASWLVRLGALLVPVGFFLGGIGNTEVDPSPPIVLVPLGALLALLGVASLAVGSWRSRSGE